MGTYVCGYIHNRNVDLKLISKKTVHNNNNYEHTEINFIQTKVRGIPVYPFLTWDSWETPLIAGTMLICFGFIYILMCFIDERIKEGRINKK